MDSGSTTRLAPLAAASRIYFGRSQIGIFIILGAI